MRYMIDTDICSYIIRKHSDRLVDKYKEIAEDEESAICISSITCSELLYVALLNPSIQNIVEGFLHEMEIAPWNKEAAYQYADIRAYLKRNGLVIGAHNMQIAAHARSIGAMVITNNNKHFKDIPGIIIRNWA